MIPLFAAAEGGSAPCIDKLLLLGATAAARDWGGNTALMTATSAAAVDQLLAAGCPLDVFACNRNELSALELQILADRSTWRVHSWRPAPASSWWTSMARRC